jgi:hypothetical protein
LASIASIAYGASMRASLGLAIGLPVLLCLSCSDVLGMKKDPHQPGDGIGVYHLTANVDLTSSCTEAVNAAPKPWTFDVTLRRDKTTGYWLSGDSPLDGTIDDQGNITFHASTPTLVHGVEKAQEIGSCTIVRSDDFSGTFAGGTVGAPTFTGTLRYGYVIDQGSDCRDVVGQPGPDRPTPLFGTLPCDVHFAVTATRTGDAPK